ncbi:hypothetical protein NOC27_379 [Nitrosococcus oceani AFC27]|nr:hypothetical protein NOC27_379 [Nitrosococcus oceani AFC27]
MYFGQLMAIIFLVSQTTITNDFIIALFGKGCGAAIHTCLLLLF